MFNLALTTRVSILITLWLSGAFGNVNQDPFAEQMPKNEMASVRLSQAANFVQQLGEHGNKDTASVSLAPKKDASVRIPVVLVASSQDFSWPQYGPVTRTALSDVERSANGSEPFNLPTLVMQRGEVQTRWADLWPRVLADEQAVSICSNHDELCSEAQRRFLSILEIGHKVKGRARLGWINRAVNLAIRPMSDWAQYGYAQYWASPLQTLGSEAGDCKDYAIVKYAVLRQLGIAPDDLRLVIVYDNLRQAEHEVLAVHYEQKWLVLDNLTMAILDAGQIRHYYPLFVMDYRGARAFTATVARR